MRSRPRGKQLLVLLFSLALIATACGGDDNDNAGPKGKDGSSSSTASTIAKEDVPEGGTLVIGAEQEPDCADWMGSCGGSSWGYWMMNVGTMPRAYDVVKEGDGYVNKPSILLAGEPKLETDPKQEITYEISEDAVWNDGEPVTSSDFKYTWDQIVNGADIYDQTGYKDIESVDDSDPKVAVVTYKNNFADWRSLFGGGYGIFPSHILEGKDRNAEMKDGYDFSAGPWVIEKWEKGSQITMVPNDKFWGDKPKLESVVFRIQADTSAEFAAFKSDQVSMIYPQPQLDAVDEIQAGIPGTQKVISTVTGNFEMLWFNNSKPPFDSKAVRKAVAYSIDRTALVKRLFGGLGLEEPLNVANAPLVADYSDVNAFEDYKLDLDQVDKLLTDDGYEKGSDDIYAKDGEKLSFTVRSTAGNARRELTEQIMQQQLKEAGIEMKIENAEAGDLFGDILPKGDYQAAIYASVLTGLTPGQCTQFCSENAPSEANEFSGQNWTRTDIPELDPLLQKIDSSLDEDERMQAGKDGDKVMAEEVPVLPIDPLPNTLLWSDKVVGPIDDNSVLGPFWNMNLWGMQS